MGISPFKFSECAADKPAVLPNPDPRRFQIEREERIGSCTIALVRYPNCTNFEGRKILVYWQVGSLLNATVLDPHFCDEVGCISPCPIARFVPTPLGWSMARAFAEVWK